MKVWRRVCVSTPLAASIRMMGGIAGGRAGGHVARVLLVARRIRDDELALRGGEVAIGHVDGDALFALGLQSVHDKREIQFARAGAAGPALALGRPRVGPQGSTVSRATGVRSGCSCRRRPSRRSTGAESLSVRAGRDSRLYPVRSGAADRTWASSMQASEIPFALLLLHRTHGIVVDQSALPLGESGKQHLLDHFRQRPRGRFGWRRTADNSRACEIAPCASSALRRVQAACVRHPP